MNEELNRRPDACKCAIEKLRDIGFDADKAIEASSVTGRWRGPEDGLPPVGARCELWVSRDRWDAVEVIGEHAVDGVEHVVVFHSVLGYHAVTMKVLRPIRSEEDKAVDEMMESGAIGAFYGAGGGAINDAAFEALFRQMFHAGYRKQESE